MNAKNTLSPTKNQKLPARISPMSTSMLPCDRVFWMKRPRAVVVSLVCHRLGQVQVVPLLPFILVHGHHLLKLTSE